MNKNVRHLNHILAKKERRIMGLMSGTSMDGLDLALCKISGYGKNTQIDVEHFVTFPYDEATVKRLKSVVSVRKADLEHICIYNSWFGNLMAEYVKKALELWKVRANDVDCIASHGQTIYHAPQSFHNETGLPSSTLQIGDGDHLATATGILTFSDFRQKHTAFGGEGAPLAVYEDYLLYQSSEEDRFLLNIGGIANFTFLPQNGDFRNIICTDTGPGNTLVNHLVSEKIKGLEYDIDGNIALSGIVNEKLLKELLKHPFFELPLPKSTGPELFNLNYINDSLYNSAITQISDADLIATVTRLTSESIAHTIRQVIRSECPCMVYVSGGGVHNKTLMRWLSDELKNCTVKDFSNLGINADAKEAVLFALLANESLWGEGLPVINQNGDITKVGLGKISFPY